MVSNWAPNELIRPAATYLLITISTSTTYLGITQQTVDE